MRRKIIFFLIMIIIIVGVIVFRISNFKTKDIVSLNNDQKTNNLSIMLQDENGKYQEGDSSFNQEGYHFNSRRSKCLMGSKIKYDDRDKSLSINTTKSDRCYAYFDNNNFVEDLSGNGNNGIVPNDAIWSNEGVSVISDQITSSLSASKLKDKFSLILTFRIDSDYVFTYEPKYFNLAGFSYKNALLTTYYKLSNGNNVIYPFYQVYYNSDGISHDSAIGNNINLKQFYTVVGVYDSIMIKLYVDGNFIKELNITDSSKRDQLKEYFSLYNGLTHKEALVFNRALTAEEIAQDYSNKINPTNKEDLLLWYKFN